MEDQIRYIKCKRCNKPLKTLEARQRGYGDFCWKQHNIEVAKKQRTLIDTIVELNSIKAM